MTTQIKEENTNDKVESNQILNKATTIIETTYEKVLSIINRVKDFIKKCSSDDNNLIKDLEWVIKVITNKSLYSYELKKEKLSRQNSEYNKFINFLTKYNEEVLEMNKKHDIVSSIFNLGKNREILLKPSLILKKVLPSEWKDMDEQMEKEKKQKNFINVFGNQILNLYHREMQRRSNSLHFKKKSRNFLEEKNNKSNEKDEMKYTYNKSNSNSNIINNNNNDNIKELINNNKNEINLKDKLKSRQKSDEILELEHIITKKNNTFDNNLNDNDALYSEQNIKRGINNINYNKDKKEINIQMVKTVTERKEKNISYNTLSKFKKNQNQINNNFYRAKLYPDTTKLTKQEKVIFSDIKKTLRNYYLKFTFNNESKSPNAQHFTIKNKFFFNNKNSYKTNYYNNIIYNNNYNKNKKSKSNNVEKGFMISKQNKYGSSQYIALSKNKKKDKINKKNEIYSSMPKIQKNDKSLKKILFLDSNGEKVEFFNPENYRNYKNNKIKLSKNKHKTVEDNHISFINEDNNNNKLNIERKTTFNEKKINIILRNDIKNNNTFQDHKNVKEENSKEHQDNQEILKALIDKHFKDIEKITDKDFNIFDFKKKVGYKNVLPIMCHAILKTLGLIDSRIITLKKLDSFLYTVSDNYKETTLYHNSLHGADVTQSLCIFFLNSNAEEICETNVLDLLGIIISAMGHDLGHPGLNNNYHINASTDLAITYNDASCLENFHSSYLFKILRKEENNIIEKLSVQNYKTIRKRMISQILATDMANHGEVVSLIRAKIKAWKEEDDQSRFNLLSGNDKSKFEEQQILLNYLIHMADLGHNCKKFEICVKWIELLTEEFWAQGDKEKEKGLTISFLCDRNKIDVPGSQVSFLRGFIISSFDCLADIFPKLKYTMENAQNNIERWKKLQDQNVKLIWTPKKEKDKEKIEKKINESNNIEI